jgi:predicted kinase
MGESRFGRPIAVLMSGEPGSGKTSLAGALAESLRVPVISKDRLRQGTLWSLRTRDIDKAPPGPPLWYAAMEAHLQLGISVVGDMALFANVSEEEVQARLAPLADLFNVHCVATSSRERLLDRTESDPIHAHRIDRLAEQTKVWTEQNRFVQLNLRCPSLVVDTTSGYEPSLDQIIDAIEEFASGRP